MALSTLWLRRAAFALLTSATAAALGVAFWLVLAAGGWSWPKVCLVPAFLLTTPWTVIGFWNAVIGFAILHLARDPLRYLNPLAIEPGPVPIAVRVAVLMAIRHETTDGIEARIRILRHELDATGFGDRFDIFVLSDSQRADTAEAEAAMMARLRRDEPHPGRLRYRRRTANDGFKAGNIAEFCRRWGAEYELMLPLDADSLMSAAAILRLVRIMQRHPRLGILQGLVVGLPADSLFTRLFQFGMRHGMRCYTAGGAWWQGDCGPYWGHNAVIRVRPFAEHCALPPLPGRPPLGGPVLSHDQVEAALMRRAGYEVRVYPIEGGSWEENPPTLPDFIRRDLRWCQGNLQYLRLIGLPGLRWMSRVQLSLAIQMYVGAPCWIAMILLGLVQAWLPAAGGAGDPVLRFGLLAATIGMSLTPKLAGLADVLVSADARRAYGGAGAVVLGGLAEILFGMLTGPVVSLSETMFMAGLLVGRRIGWEAQQRAGRAIGWRMAARGLWPHTLFGLLAGLSLALSAPGAVVWAAPLLASFLLSVPVAVVTASRQAGALATRFGLCAIPDERMPEPAVARLLGWEPVATVAGRRPVRV